VPTEPSWFHPEAIEEARAAREWYSARNPDAGDAFMAELDTAIARIEQAPNQWAPYLGGTRRYLFHRFPFFVVFRDSHRDRSSRPRTPPARVLAWTLAI
jgi:plasmid stabilization system protein ParE